jgi:hypothetical protein
LSHSNIGSTSTLPCVATTRHPAARALFQLRYMPRLLVSRLQRLYLNYATRLGASAIQATRRRLLRLCRTSRCLGSSRDSSSATSPTPHVRVPRHIARIVTWLVVDYFTSCRLVVDYFAYTMRLGASVHRAACRVTHRGLLCLRRAFGCLGMSRDSLSTTSPRAGSSSTTSPTPCVRVPRHVARLVVDYFTYDARPGASARRAACRRLLRLCRGVRVP